MIKVILGDFSGRKSCEQALREYVFISCKYVGFESIIEPIFCGCEKPSHTSSLPNFFLSLQSNECSLKMGSLLPKKVSSTSRNLVSNDNKIVHCVTS